MEANWVLGHKCEVCKDADAVMALAGRNREVLCRMCFACYNAQHLKTEYEAWRGDMIEAVGGENKGEAGDCTDEYMIRMDWGNL